MPRRSRKVECPKFSKDIDGKCMYTMTSMKKVLNILTKDKDNISEKDKDWVKRLNEKIHMYDVQHLSDNKIVDIIVGAWANSLGIDPQPEPPKKADIHQLVLELVYLPQTKQEVKKEEKIVTAITQETAAPAALFGRRPRGSGRRPSTRGSGRRPRRSVRSGSVRGIFSSGLLYAMRKYKK